MPSVTSSFVDPQAHPAAFRQRIVTLCDGRAGLRGGLQVACREPASGEVSASATGNIPAVLDFIASNETLDRYDEILSAGGWRLENYRRNPVFQNAHQYGDVIFTLGKALVTEVRSGGASGQAPYLFQRVQFAIEANPMARIAYGLYKGGFLNAVSVGFIPIRWENGGARDSFKRRYLEQELLEVSAVGIPANPDALQLGLRAGAVRRADLVDALETIIEARRRSSRPQENVRPGTQLSEGQVEEDHNQTARLSFELACALGEILKRN